MSKIPKLPSMSNMAKKILNSKPAKYLTNPKAAGAAVMIATISNVTKDGVNCAYYVTQSLNNERIPEDQRKFVAGMDLANGILNVTLQTFAGTAIGKAAEKFFDKTIAPKYFSDDACKEMYNKLESKIKFEEFKGLMEKNKGFAKAGFSVIAALVGMQVVIKRIVVPLIATPMASVFKNQMEKMDKKKDQVEDKFEKLEDKAEAAIDKIEDKFELQKKDD